MATIHRTTMTPTKLELLESWLPTQPWYVGMASPALSKAGGFRLDDPQGEVGIEFMIVNDTAGGESVTYHAPLTYRGAPLEGAGDALVGTSEHGVLGKRWIYDGTHDPVLMAQLRALFRSQAEPQAQNLSNTPDPTVTARLATTGGGVMRVIRVLHPDGTGPTAEPLGAITAGWTTPDGTACRGTIAAMLDEVG